VTKTLFDHLSAIYTDQSIEYFNGLSEADQRTFSTYMIHRLVSMDVTVLPIVNEIQRYPLTARDTYLFYSQLLPNGRRYHKYVKGQKDMKYEPWLVDTMRRYYYISKQEAMEYLDTYYQTAAGKQEVRRICQFFGTSDKQMKKVKL
jgi:hypothetical protein